MLHDIISKLEINRTHNNDMHEEGGHPEIEPDIRPFCFLFFTNYL